MSYLFPAGMFSWHCTQQIKALVLSMTLKVSGFIVDIVYFEIVVIFNTFDSKILLPKVSVIETNLI